MGKGNSFSISCSKKLTQCDSYISLNTDSNSILFFFKETPLANLGEKLLGTTEMFRKKKKIEFSNVLWLISDFISVWDVFTVENTDKDAFWLRGTSWKGYWTCTYTDDPYSIYVWFEKTAIFCLQLPSGIHNSGQDDTFPWCGKNSIAPIKSLHFI